MVIVTTKCEIKNKMYKNNVKKKRNSIVITKEGTKKESKFEINIAMGIGSTPNRTKIKTN